MSNIDGKWIVKKFNDEREIEYHFYCTKDEFGQYTNVRIRIELGKYHDQYVKNLSNCKKIYTIKGAGVGSNLEEEMEPILRNKLESLRNEGIPSFSIDFFLTLLSRSEDITRFKYNTLNNMPLGRNELIELYGAYELKEKYQTGTMKYAYQFPIFGDVVDPRIEEILELRKMQQQEDFEKFTKFEKNILLKRDDYEYSIKISDKGVIVETEGLKYASDELLKDPAFIRHYMKNTGINVYILKYAAPNIRKNKRLVKEILGCKITDDVKYVDAKLLADEEIMARFEEEICNESTNNKKDIKIRSLKKPNN